jgi:hypothetical protein
MYKRSATIRHNVERRIGKHEKFEATVNGKPVKTFLQPTFTVRDYEVYETEDSSGLYIHMPELEPLSINFVVIKNVTCGSCKSERNSKLIYRIDESTFLENDQIRVDFDKKTFYPNKILFKNKSLSLDLSLEIIRYPNSKSESGAYIHAPYTKPQPLKMKILGAFLIQSDFHDKIVVFYKSSYINACFSLINIVINK